MSYRITARDELYDEEGILPDIDKIYHQLYSNNEFPERLKDYLISKGVKFDEDSCFYNYKVTDIQELLEVMFEIHKEQVLDESYWNINPYPRHKVDTVYDLLSSLEYKLDVLICLQVYNFYKAFQPCLSVYWDESSNSEKYKIKDGKNIYLSGF